MKKLKKKYHLWMIKQIIKLYTWLVVYKEKHKHEYLLVEGQLLEEESRKIKPDTRFKNKIEHVYTETCLRDQYVEMCEGKRPTKFSDCTDKKTSDYIITDNHNIA